MTISHTTCWNLWLCISEALWTRNHQPSPGYFLTKEKEPSWRTWMGLENMRGCINSIGSKSSSLIFLSPFLSLQIGRLVGSVSPFGNFWLWRTTRFSQVIRASRLSTSCPAFLALSHHLRSVAEGSRCWHQCCKAGCYKTASPSKPPARELCLIPHIKVPYANFSYLHRVAHIRAQQDLISNNNPLTGMLAGMPGPSCVRSELGIAAEILMGRERSISKTPQREIESLYFTAVVLDSEGVKKIFPYCRTVECAHTKNIFYCKKKNPLIFFSSFQRLKKLSSWTLQELSAWQTADFHFSVVREMFSLLATANWTLSITRVLFLWK